MQFVIKLYASHRQAVLFSDTTSLLTFVSPQKPVIEAPQDLQAGASFWNIFESNICIRCEGVEF